MKLTDEMHDAVKNSPVGQFIDRLIREEVARGSNVGEAHTHLGIRGNVIQALWEAFMSGRSTAESDGPSLRQIKQEIKNASIS
jgi:hypothetical protein